MATRATGDLELFMSTMVASREPLSTAFAERVAREQFGQDGVAERLTGERDDNFRLTASTGVRYVLKFASAAEDERVTDLSTAALQHVERVTPDLPCPRVCRAPDGRTLMRVTDNAQLVRTARLVTYLEGTPLRHAARSLRQRECCGRLAARLGQALRNFRHPASHRIHAWDLRNVPLLRPLLDDLPDLPHSSFVAGFIDWFEAGIVPRLAALRHQFIHNDFNDRNILVDARDPHAVTGIIDFGDCVHTVLVADLAIAAVAQITDPDAAEQTVTDIARAYDEVEPLLPAEWALLGPLAAARIVTGILIPSWHLRRNPTSEHYDAFDETHLRRRVALATQLMQANLQGAS